MVKESEHFSATVVWWWCTVQMLVGLSGYLTGYDGSFHFSKPGDEYGDTNYVGMRVVSCFIVCLFFSPFSFGEGRERRGVGEGRVGGGGGGEAEKLLCKVLVACTIEVCELMTFINVKHVTFNVTSLSLCFYWSNDFAVSVWQIYIPLLCTGLYEWTTGLVSSYGTILLCTDWYSTLICELLITLHYIIWFSKSLSSGEWPLFGDIICVICQTTKLISPFMLTKGWTKAVNLLSKACYILSLLGIAVPNC